MQLKSAGSRTNNFLVLLFLNAQMAAETFSAVDEMADGAKETLQELIETLETAAASSGLVTSLVHNLTQAISKVRQ